MSKFCVHFRKILVDGVLIALTMSHGIGLQNLSKLLYVKYSSYIMVSGKIDLKHPNVVRDATFSLVQLYLCDIRYCHVIFLVTILRVRDRGPTCR